MRIFDPLPEGRTLSVMPTFRCTAECDHCGTLSSPRESTWLPRDLMLRVIGEAADNGYKVVVFTGGEPTLAGADLLEGIRLARSRGLVARMVTNGHWAVHDAAADRKIGELVDAGLNEINFSTGDQHARFVPMERVLRGARAAAKAGLTIAIMVETVNERRITKETVEKHPEFQRLREEHPDARLRLHESPWMPLIPSKVFRYPEGLAINRANLAWRAGCDSVLGTTTLQANGNLGACCGIGMKNVPELSLGNARDVPLAEADAKAGDDFLKRWIRVEGPEKILDWASRHDPSIQWEDMYAHRCQACIRLYTDPAVRRVIREKHQEKMADVVFGEWLLFKFQGADDPVVAAPPEP